MNVKKMVDRFLCWKLPKDFGPDGGITFNRHINGDEREFDSPFWPVGTNLLTADQAKQMFIYAANFDADMDFGMALDALKAGKKVARAGWNGKGMFVYYVPANRYRPTTESARAYFGGADVPYNAYFAIKNANETVSTWVPSVNDCLSEDWMILP